MKLNGTRAEVIRGLLCAERVDETRPGSQSSIPDLIRCTGTVPVAIPAPPPVHDGTHDFDFIHGAWHIHNRRLRHPLTESTEWYEFEGDSVPCLRPRRHIANGTMVSWDNVRMSTVAWRWEFAIAIRILQR